MYTKKQVIHKLLLGTVMLAVAICITLFIRENMNVQSPEQALPTFTISMNGAATFAPESVFRAGYEWNFFTTTAKHTPEYSPADLKMATPPVPMPPRTILDLEFSIEPKHLTISRAEDEDFRAFMDLIDVGMGPIITPAAPGLYQYRVQADFGWRGSIIYFFTVQIVDASSNTAA